MSDSKPKTKAEQRIITMQSLMEVGRAAFTQHGYADASMEEIVAQAGVTRGALYHHFGSKEGLFKAVLETIQTEVAQRIEESSDAESDLWDQLLAGCRAFLAASLDPAIQRIMLLDAPAVLGWETWRAMDEQHSGQLLHGILTELVNAGQLQPLPITALTRLLSGAMNEAALWIAQSSNPQTALAESILTLEALLQPLRVRPR